MHRPQLSSLLFSLLLAPPAHSATSLDCKNLRVGGVSFNFEKLGGPHSVVTSRWEPNPPELFNTTYTLDICKPLKKSGKSKKGEECPNGTRVCAIQRLLKDDTDTVTEVTAISGALQDVGGSVFDFDATRLKSSDSTSDSQKEGVRLVLTGGKHPLSGAVKDRRSQKAIIEFLCDPEKTGLEGEWDSEDKYETETRKRDDSSGDGDDKTKDGDDKSDGDKSDGDGDGETTKEHQLKKEGAALIWDSYGDENDMDVLRLTWHTKYACEKREDDGGDDSDGERKESEHWGFFTWFIILVFLGIAAYLIFGSWLNYNRYGARGWDLLPHGDTLRDIPYLMKDWIRRVLNTVQGTGSRGGYSAV